VLGHDHGFDRDRDHVDLDDHPREPELPGAVLGVFPPVFAPPWLIWKDSLMSAVRMLGVAHDATAGEQAERSGSRASC
jgi:hypothetical protein